jgi:NAD(P)H-flavin reductase/hemoglobin-like flavoprotein
LDVARLRESFAHVTMHGDEFPLFFYSDLFIKHPEVRDLFPISMAAQRGHLVDALVKIVSQVDSVNDLTVFLQGLGRDHRKFGVVAEHYDAVGDSLLTTLEHFSGPAWTPELAADWRAAYELIGSVMTKAARADEQQQRPPWWRGTVVACEQRAFDISVLFVRPEPRMDYVPGQSVAIECPSRPKLWRYYSMANAPRRDGILEFHIRVIDGGAVSLALTSRKIVDTELRLGPPVGVLTLSNPASSRDLLLVAGSTGLAPLKAILDQVTGLDQPPRVHLFFGARTADGLYDLDSLEKMAAQHPWLTVTPAASADSRFAGETGSLPDVVARHGDWSGHEAYLAGPTEMVQETVSRLASAGLAQEQIHIEDFGWSEP